MTEIVTNHDVEKAAIEWVLHLERQAGREPQDTRHELGAPADINSPPRLIEVKAYGKSARGEQLWLEVPQVEAARGNRDFYVYVVENVRQGDPGEFSLKVLGGDRLARLMERAKERRYFTVPFPVAEYDASPDSLDLEPTE